MANRGRRISGSVSGNSSEILDDTPIPTGKRLVVSGVRISEVNSGDGKSSLVTIRWGSGTTFFDVFIGAVTGSTLYFPIEEELVGDGVKFLRIIRQNTSPLAKQIFVFLNSFDR